MTKGDQVVDLQGNALRTLVHDGIQIELYRDPAGGLILCAVVFLDSYLPHSVRQTVEEANAPLLVDEQRGRVLLVDTRLSHGDVERLLPEFTRVASYWRRLLNERGNRDLLFVSR